MRPLSALGGGLSHQHCVEDLAFEHCVANSQERGLSREKGQGSSPGFNITLPSLHARLAASLLPALAVFVPRPRQDPVCSWQTIVQSPGKEGWAPGQMTSEAAALTSQDLALLSAA